ncbi:MAG TPA: ribulokinase [Candidatus Limnocylindrales bacterium]|nr:ribulokinase [Candidatus Limnocylindrales bacterium]
MASFAIGVDFGTGSGRAILVDVADGRQLATAVSEYSHGVIDDVLPLADRRVVLPPDWALQDPEDYLRVFRESIPAVLRESGVDPADVIGLGIDFTACTMLPTTADGTPLALIPEFRANPHAWVKLWKHHAAQPEADRINAVAEATGQPWLDRYGGRISSEWFFSKALQILDEAPAIYAAADRLLEAADWVVWRLTGVETRNACTAGYKALWSKDDGFPDTSYFAALDPRLATIVDEKMSREIRFAGERAGRLTEEAAMWTGLPAGTAVAVANVDAHVAVPAATVVEPGRMVMIMGTSTCHMVLSADERSVPGMCGQVRDGIIPGYVGYEAGQSAVGDHFSWFVENAVPEAYRREARERGLDIYGLLEEKAARLPVGKSGLLALDWWNGNRSVLVDAALGGLLVGATLATVPEEIYRALIEATAFGTRVIIETFETHGVPIREIVACGGLADKSPLTLQIYADVTGRPFRLSASEQTPALGSAMFGAVAAGVAAGGHATIEDASAAMARLQDRAHEPIAANRVVYDELYREYVRLHDYFGRGANDVMKVLKRLRADARDGGAADPSAEALGATLSGA